MSKPLPENIRELAAGRSYRQLAALLGRCANRLQRAVKEYDPALHEEIVERTAKRRRPMPDDFVANCNIGMSASGLMKHYDCSRDAIDRWLHEAGEDVRKRVAKASRQTPVMSQNARANLGRIGQSAVRRFADEKVNMTLQSEADKAMRWLQKFGPCYPLRIYRANLEGYRFAGKIWQAGELIAEAERRGWDVNAWRRIAA